MNKFNVKFFAFVTLLSTIIIGNITNEESFCVNAKESNEADIRIGCFPLKGFFDYDSNNNISGYGIDYIEEVCSNINITYEPITFKNWDAALQGLADGTIDVLAPGQHSEERDELYQYSTFPIGTEYGALFTLATNEDLNYEDFVAFNKLDTACVDTLIFKQDFLSYQEINQFEVNLDTNTYQDTASLIDALKKNKISAFVSNLMVKTEELKILARFGVSPYYFMFGKENSELATKFNRALDQINSQNPIFQSSLEKKYFPNINQIPYSKKELDYIKEIKSVNVACESNSSPFSFYDQTTEKVAGFDFELLEYITELSGLKFKCFALPNDNLQSFYQENSIQLIAGVEKSFEEDKRFFTIPYFEVSKCFVGLKNIEFDANKSMLVASISTSMTQINSWKSQYPYFTFLPYDTIAEAMNDIKIGKIDLILDNRYSLENVLASPKNSQFEILPISGISENVCYELIQENDEYDQTLLSILNKSIAFFSNTKVETILAKVTGETSYQYTIGDFLYQYKIMLLIIAFFLILSFAILLSFILFQRKTSKILKSNELKLSNITNNINGGVVVLKDNNELEITFANDGFLELIGSNRNAFNLNNHSCLTYIHQDDVGKLNQAIKNNNEFSIELKIMKQNKQYIPTLFNCTVGNTVNGNKELYCVIMDMSEQYRLLEKLKIENNRIEFLLSRVDEVFYQINLKEKTIITSDSFKAKLGWELPHKIKNLDDENEYKDNWKIANEDKDKLIMATHELLKTKKPVSTIVHIESLINHTYIWCEILQHPILSVGNEIISILGVLRNVDEEVKERERLIEKSLRDPLTGLYNKDAFEMKVKESLARDYKENNAIIFIDLDYFKNVNDTLGHLVGDRAICDAADKLKVVFQNYDIISRFGGDEFCIFAKNVDEDSLHNKLKWLVEKIHCEYHDKNKVVKISCSCGVALTYGKDVEYTTLLNCSDKALYTSKENGKDQYTIYSSKVEKS